LKKAILTLAVLLFVYVSSASAWWSETAAQVFNSTHRNLTGSARGLLNNADYPDIEKYGSDISNWTSGGTDDIRAHNPDSENVPVSALDPLLNRGPIDVWWKRAQIKYKEDRNFNSGDWSAYYYVALMMHLIEDQAVPAHAYNIKHGSAGYMDNLEQLANFNYNPNPSGVVPAADPLSNYNALNMYTLVRTLFNDPNSYWRAYWQYGVTCANAADYTSVYGGPPIETEGQESSGYYGCPNDVFPTSWWVTAGINEKNLTKELLGQAVGYTAGGLIAVSQNLPPLTKDLAIDGATSGTPKINTEKGSTITFDLYENRQPDVYVLITVDSQDGKAIMDADNNASVSYLQWDLKEGKKLPYERPFTAKWKGKLADGT